MKKSIFLFVATILLFACGTKLEQADLLVHNARIYTVDSNFTIVDAMVVKNGKILATGSANELKQKFDCADSLNLDGKIVYPGFIDAHCHFFGYGLAQTRYVDLTGTQSFSEVIEKVVAFAKEHPDYTWIEGRGWDQNDWKVKEFPSNAEINKLFPDKPVYLSRIDGHAALVNDVALKLAGFSNISKMSGGDFFIKNGKLTGLLIDAAKDSMQRVIPEADDNLATQSLLRAQEDCFAVGLTSVHDAGLPYHTVKLIDSLQTAQILKMRMNVMLEPTEENFEKYVKKGIYKTDYLNVRSIKVYSDGALGSRGALLIKPYSDDPHNHGLLLVSQTDFDKVCKLAYENNYQVCTHAIGDSANRFVFNTYAKYLKGKNDFRWRIEHAQVVSLSDRPFFSQYSIVPSVQSTHATSDMYWAEDRLGNERIKTAYAYKSLMEQNGWLPNGSDFPVEQVNPLLGFYAAVARKDVSGYPENGFQAEEALLRNQALMAMTIWAAKAAFEENEKGSLEPGKWADFVVLGEDIIQIPLAQIPNIKVLQTYIAGKNIYFIKN